MFFLVCKEQRKIIPIDKVFQNWNGFKKMPYSSDLVRPFKMPLNLNISNAIAQFQSPYLIQLIERRQ